MWEFSIQLRSVQEVQKFVSIATTAPFPVQVRSDDYQANGKSFMEMFCLDFTHPLTASLDCSEDQFNDFRQSVSRFLAK